ncbi:4'-phosphopantetheinyl transferase family protein [Rufibacter roseus]|uniref:Enterobactin synthase component D n=1 Tax=Rufibacter roseus TaxID=1567108 RepID=A0ABW2DKI4_9BACT|nr:4'-phosphopantetheinyl transferase family protein [Rufibacter roseus]
MPLLRVKQLNSTSYLGLWRVEETVEQLRASLLELRPSHEIPVFKAETRNKEWLAARILAYTLLAELTHEPVLLEKHETGQPYCTAEHLQVSLTHSGPWVAALISATYRVGIDIEQKGNKVERLISKFMNEIELAAVENRPEKMHLYWSAKETLYKVYSHKKLLFKENIRLQYFDLQPEGQFKGRVQTDNFKEDYDVLYESTPDYVLTYTLAPLAETQDVRHKT